MNEDDENKGLEKRGTDVRGIDLGGDVYVSGIDVEPGERIDVAIDRDRDIDQWAASKGESGAPPDGPDWNTWPFGVAGACRKRLFVDVRDTAEIEHCLRYVHVHLRQCPETEHVVFHIGGSIGFLDWSTAFRAKVPTLRIVAPNAKFATRVSANWLPRTGQRPDTWRGCIPQRLVDDNHQGIPVPATNLAAFKHRIWLLEELGLLKLRFSYVQQWTNQPDHPTFTLSHGITFGEQIDTAGRMQSWSARVYLPPLDKNRHPMPVAGFHAINLWRKVPPCWFGNGVGFHQTPPPQVFQKGQNDVAVVPDSVAEMDGNPYAFLNSGSPQLVDQRPINWTYLK